eukprot:TRINITY_DN9064_c0_g1_i2.p1 TRINITY_DN9064_c0_g1~~TRINITY_DN9064_c0_g1_i2.p1  ORF type:complete len:107 (+),score=10.61 TRINITY_DN9064_c0_g1_i2:81-401(+)
MKVKLLLVLALCSFLCTCKESNSHSDITSEANEELIIETPSTFAKVTAGISKFFRSTMQLCSNVFSHTSEQIQDKYGLGYSKSLSLIHICRCRRLLTCRSRWSPYH